jgi:hypothetical protein
MNITQKILSQLRGRFGRFGGSGRGVRRELLPDRHFATRLRAGGAARILPGQGGHIGPEPRLFIPFEIEAGDAEVKVAVFSDPPGLLSLEIEMPDRTPLAAARDAGKYALSVDQQLGTCSFELPADAWPPPQGTWRVVLRVDTESFKHYLMGVRGSYPREFERLAATGVYYSVSALAARRPAPASSWQPSLRTALKAAALKLLASLPAWLAEPWRERQAPFAGGRQELVLPLP